MSTQEEATFIEGIGDEVIYGISFLFITLTTIGYSIYHFILKRGYLTDIHEENEETVQEIREEIINTRTGTGPSGNTSSRRMVEGDVTCPICLAQARYAVETNCGHIFCGECMITYWRHGNWIAGLKCPVCRSQVSILLRCFTREEIADRSTDKDDILREMNHYNRRYSGQPIPWVDYLRDLPTLLRHLWAEFFSVGGLVVMFRLRILVLFVMALLYFISPLDLLPEAVFGVLGLIDDLFILLLLAIYLSIMYRQLIAQRAANAPT